MILKTLKLQFAAAAALSLGVMVAPTPSMATGSNYCECLTIACAPGGPYAACMDYCAGIHMQTICKKATPKITMDRR